MALMMTHNSKPDDEGLFPVQRVVKAVEAGYSTSEDIAEMTGMNSKTVSSYLSIACQLGVIEKTGVIKTGIYLNARMAVYIGKDE